MLVASSFLTSKNIPKDLKILNDTSVDFIHVDIMDGKFVKNKTKSFTDIYKYTSKRLDVHLMVEHPKKDIVSYSLLNVDTIIIHVEIKDKIDELIDLIHGYGIKAGLAISPGTDVDMLDKYLDKIDKILIMSVVPGEGGQEFLMDSVDRINKIKEKISNKNILLEIDGGINNITKDYCNGVDILVAGNYIISSDNYETAINSLRQ